MARWDVLPHWGRDGRCGCRRGSRDGRRGGDRCGLRLLRRATAAEAGEEARAPVAGRASGAAGRTGLAEPVDHRGGDATESESDEDREVPLVGKPVFVDRDELAVDHDDLVLVELVRVGDDEGDEAHHTSDKQSGLGRGRSCVQLFSDGGEAFLLLLADFRDLGGVSTDDLGEVVDLERVPPNLRLEGSKGREQLREHLSVAEVELVAALTEDDEGVTDVVVADLGIPEDAEERLDTSALTRCGGLREDVDATVEKLGESGDDVCQVGELAVDEAQTGVGLCLVLEHQRECAGVLASHDGCFLLEHVDTLDGVRVTGCRHDVSFQDIVGVKLNACARNAFMSIWYHHRGNPH